MLLWTELMTEAIELVALGLPVLLGIALPEALGVPLGLTKALFACTMKLVAALL